MAWPPAALPTNRTNATPQQDTHPADHNAVNLAVNDTVARVQFIESNGARLGTGAHQGGMSIASGAVVNMAWETVSDPAWGAGPILTVPNVAYSAGIYAISLRVAGPTNTGLADVVLNIGGVAFVNFIPTGKTAIAFSQTLQLAVGTQIYVQVYNPNPAAQFYNADLQILKVQS